MVRVRFNELPQPIRARFAAAAQAHGDPRVLFYSPIRSAAILLYGLALALTLLFELALVSSLLGRGARVEPSYSVATYVSLALCTTALMGFLLAIVHRIVARPKAYRDGHYVLATALVKVELGEMTILPIAEVGRPQLTHYRRNGSYTGTSVSYAPGFVMPVHGQEVAVGQAARVLQAQEYCARVMQARDSATLEQIDVFHELTISNQWAHPNQPKAEPWSQTISLVAVAARLGAALAIGVVFSVALYLFVDVYFEGDRQAERKKWPSSTTPPTTATTTPTTTATTPTTPPKRR